MESVSMGLYFDLIDQTAIKHAKKLMIDYVRTLEADTEDKVYLYDNGIHRETFLSETIARIANWRVSIPGKHPSASLGELGDWMKKQSGKRSVVIFTDGKSSGLSQAVRSLKQKINRDIGREYPILVFAYDGSILDAHFFFKIDKDYELEDFLGEVNG